MITYLVCGLISWIIGWAFLLYFQRNSNIKRNKTHTLRGLALSLLFWPVFVIVFFGLGIYYGNKRIK